MFHNYSVEDLRSLCRTNIESLEIWARRLIHDELTEVYGENYIDHIEPNGDNLIKTNIKNQIINKMCDEPDRFQRAVDALFLDDIIYFLCTDKFYRNIFKPALDYSYPNGSSEVRTFLNRLIVIRNSLSHSNHISIRQAEQAICYAHDFIDSLKNYYIEKGKEQMWNVPSIIKITDSLGNVFHNPNNNSSMIIFNLTQTLHYGETYSVNIEVDPSFEDSEYDIVWKNNNRVIHEFNNQKSFTITFKDDDVSQNHFIRCAIKSHKPWHKFQHHDCEIYLSFSVLPPI